MEHFTTLVNADRNNEGCRANALREIWKQREKKKLLETLNCNVELILLYFGWNCVVNCGGAFSLAGAILSSYGGHFEGGHHVTTGNRREQHSNSKSSSLSKFNANLVHLLKKCALKWRQRPTFWCDCCDSTKNQQSFLTSSWRSTDRRWLKRWGYATKNIGSLRSHAKDRATVVSASTEK